MVVREQDLGPDLIGILPPRGEMRGYNVDICPPELPYGIMGDLMRLMEKGRWEIPSIDGLSLDELGSLAGRDIEEIRDGIADWKLFCISATIGGKMAQPDLFGVERPKRQEVRAIMSWVNTKEILGRVSKLDDEGAKELLGGAKRAFKSLLGEGKMKPGDTKKAREFVGAFSEYAIEFGLAWNPITID